MKKQKLTSLQALRALAFLAIFLSHCDDVRLGLWGGVGVSIFFVLSGFVMMYSYYDRDLSVSFKDNILFSLKKISALLFLNILAVTSGFILSIRTIIKTDKIEGIVDLIVKYLLDLLMVQAWIPDKKYYFALNGGSWFLSACLFIYFVFPWILKKMRMIKKCSRAVLVGIVTYVIQFVSAYGVSRLSIGNRIGDNFVKWVTYICPVYRLGCFVIGCSVGLAFVLLKKPESKKTIYDILFTVAEAVAIATVFLSCYAYRHIFTNANGGWIRSTLLRTPGSVLMVLLFAMNYGLITKLLNTRLFIFIGDLSPYMFLIHQQILSCYGKLIKKYWVAGESFWTKTIIVFITSLILSKIYCFLKEKQIIKPLLTIL